MEESIIDVEDGLNLDAGLIKLLAIRAGKTVNRIIADPIYLSRMQRKEIVKLSKNSAADYRAKVERAVQRDSCTRSYISLLSMEEAFAAIEAAVHNYAHNPTAVFEDEITKSIISGEFRRYMKEPYTARHELRRTLLDAGIETLENYITFPEST